LYRGLEVLGSNFTKKPKLQKHKGGFLTCQALLFTELIETTVQSFKFGSEINSPPVIFKDKVLLIAIRLLVTNQV